jgi:hypothetical protein
MEETMKCHFLAMKLTKEANRFKKKGEIFEIMILYGLR